MRVLITGADGFIGSHLVETCIEDGYQVKAIVQYNSFNSLGWLDSIPEGLLNEIEIISTDVRDAWAMRKAAENVDYIFHLAALVSVPFSYHTPDQFVQTNIQGTLNLLQAAKNSNINKIIITSTSEVYGTADYIPIDEKHPLKAQSPYAASKIAADKIAESFYRSFNTPVIIARPFNTYGPRQSLRAVIPTIICQALSETTSIKLGSLHPERDLNFVKDTCQAFLKIATAEGLCGEVINIASEKSISIGELATLIINMINPEIEIISENKRVRPAQSEVKRLMGSTEKIRRLTGWKPTYTLRKGIEQTIRWFRENKRYKKRKSEQYNI